MASRTAYSRLQITLHWLVALLIALAWFLGDDMDKALRARIDSGATGIEGNTLHVWTGSAIFALVLLRLIVRAVQGAPEPVPGLAPWQEAAARWGHRALYAMMLIVPALGATAWYGHWRDAGDLHEDAVGLLLLLIAGHAAISLVHHYLLRDDTLRRMIPLLR